jgi:hypothetical protein
MTDETIHEERRKRSRKGIASYLRRIANALGRGDPVPADEDQTVTVDPPAEPTLQTDVERDEETLSLGIEMEWDEADGDVETETNASKATFRRYVDSGDQWRWRLVHDNGNIIADGSEGYASKQKATQGLKSVKSNAPGGAVVDLSKEETTESPDDGSDAVFELYEDKAGEYRWRLVHDNGNIIADSGQGYASKQKAKQGLRSVKQNVPGAAIEDVDGE